MQLLLTTLLLLFTYPHIHPLLSSSPCKQDSIKSNVFLAVTDRPLCPTALPCQSIRSDKKQGGEGEMRWNGKHGLGLGWIGWMAAQNGAFAPVGVETN